MKDVKGERVRRSYQSPVRTEGAQRTRQAIVRAAGELFVTQGYTATSLANVASVAGVARPTVFAAFGSKGALLKQVLDEALAGDDEPVPVAQRPWFRPVWDATTPEAVLTAYAEVCTVIGGRAARIFESVHRAAGSSPELTQMWDTLVANRRIGGENVVRHMLAVAPAWQPRYPAGPATDVLCLLNDPAHYGALVLDRGWEVSAFQGWLAAAMRDALLRAHPDT